jgi:hypothetical protein
MMRWLWDVVEESAGGHERRRRLAWRMTGEQAQQWGTAHGLKLDRVDEAHPGSLDDTAQRAART